MTDPERDSNRPETSTSSQHRSNGFNNAHGPVNADLPILQAPGLSNKAIVHIKQVFAKPRMYPSSSPSGLDDWKCIRSVQANNEAGNSQDRRSASSIGTVGSPKHVPASSVVSPRLVQEPGSYLPSPVLSNSNNQRDMEYDSDDSHSGDEYPQYNKLPAAGHRSQAFHKSASRMSEKSYLQRVLNILRLPTLTAVQRGVLKCSIAYFLASLFTFVPALSNLFASPFDLEGPVSGAHVIATVATYYNPAKTLGAMIEADIFMLWAAAFALLTALGSMATASLLNGAGFHTSSHVVTVVFWLSGAMALVAWMKVKVSNAQFGSVSEYLLLIIDILIE